MPSLADEEIAKWKTEIVARGFPSQWVNAYSRYIDCLSGNNVPVIFEGEHLALLIGLNPSVITQAVKQTSSFYRSFTVPKRNGGERSISAPLPSMLLIQRWIHDEILSGLKVHETAHAYVSGRSHISHAERHLYANACLKIDLKDFFDSFRTERIMSLFNKLGYLPSVSFQLGALTTLNGKMPQGAATSPSLSNIICVDLDRKLSSYATAYRLTYSRYSDDICISGADVSRHVIEEVKNIIVDEGFIINTRKSTLMDSSGRRIITGISIGSGTAKPPREFRRLVRKQVYDIKKKGLYCASFHGEKFDPYHAERVLGRINYWLQIEPKSNFVIQARNYVMLLVKGQMT